MLRERNTAFRSGDRELFSAARAMLKRGIREAAYKKMIEDCFHCKDANPVW